MTLSLAIIIISLTIIVGVALYVLFARFSPEGGRGEKTPTGVYAVTAGAMSLLIAFTMSLTFQQYRTAQLAVPQEAEAVMAMSRATMLMKPRVRDQLRNQLVCYADQVIHVEWPSMQSGSGELPPEIRETVRKMDSIVVMNIAGARRGVGLWESANQQRLAAQTQTLSTAGKGVPAILWLLLIVGSIITIGSLFVYADRSKPGWGHAVVVVGPLFIASAALVVIAFFDHPYADTRGSITPAAMELTLDKITHDRIANLPLPFCPKTS